jgi:hypothetical protein
MTGSFPEIPDLKLRRVGWELGRGAGVVYENLDQPGWVVKKIFKGASSPTPAQNEYQNLQMDQADNERATAREIMSCAQKQGLDLEPLRNDFAFQTGQRWVVFWRKRDGLPSSGPDGELDGTLHCSMQGAISTVPNQLEVLSAGGDEMSVDFAHRISRLSGAAHSPSG